MYGSIWRALPGPWPVKLLYALIFLAAIAIALVAWVFPWIDALLMPQDGITVGDAAATARAAAGWLLA